MSTSIPSRPRTPLARATLLQMGIRIAVVIALGTLFSYLHLFKTLRDQSLGQLERSVVERGQREESIFVLAEDNHALLKKALQERIQAVSEEEVSARFDRLFVQLPDGTIRNRPEGFDGTKMPGLFVLPGVSLEGDFRRRVVASYDVLIQNGPILLTRFKDTYIMLPEGGIVVFWPERPTWCQDAEPTLPLLSYDYFTNSLPQNNPQRRTSWTSTFEESVSKLWMVTASTPLDMDGRHVATLHHDVLLDELMDRTANGHLPGAYNVIFRDNGELIIHPELKLEGTVAYNIRGAALPGVSTQLGSPEQRAHLRDIFERVTGRTPEQTVMELSEHREYLAATRLKGPGWNFVTVLPDSAITAPALEAARYVLVFGLASLVLELAIRFWVLQQQISRPLLAFTHATDQIAAGNFKVELDTRRQDELGQLAQAFRLMADEVQRREEALRQSNERLEQRVDERTRELKDVHRQLVQVARQAGRAEVATSVLHNVGNVLNSVHTSAMLAKERLMGLQVEDVSHLAAMLEERRNDLASFLTQDERGQHVMPFLSGLGQHLRTECHEAVSLLDEVGRYTEHIGTIVKLQQNYTRTPRLNEQADLAELLEDALRINSAGLTRHEVKVERHLSPVPQVTTDKHKVLMILVNLISNSKYALDAAPAEQRCLTLRMEASAADRVRIEVRDNGMGIAPELLTRIFQHGFTTRDEGHGFGLHSSALAAQELGGTLTAHSEGPGRGATFILELPCTPPEAT
ncbi:sensor histidine kinase [Archangium sp.]|uniref:sensor histidine kinase n=1 Tax=Archangium sp. TaxID=1872627 RepID=UPI002D738FFA|nr:ATP-binding protein [Archangium sp.]HYO59390.1 ATP-binding protein [Archangium sp.]